MPKSPWEKRVGMLLDPEKHPEFLYSYKPPDTMHGGQPKLDWFACDTLGRFWLIEVKWLPETRVSINLRTEVTAGQTDALNQVAFSETGVPLLAVGRGDRLWVYDWREVISWQLQQSTENLSRLLPLGAATFQLRWFGPKAWDHSLYSLVGVPVPVTALTPPVLELLSHNPAPSASISKPRGSTPIVPLMRPLEP